MWLHAAGAARGWSIDFGVWMPQVTNDQSGRYTGMKMISRILSVAVMSGALLAATASAHATDVPAVASAKRIPVPSESNTNTFRDFEITFTVGQEFDSTTALDE
ncbi:hypothetical protein [Streptomyces subrutilus]|uniref:hypothetical protein n=1 Tax=Streptomyces subrutilus TaxID=36818 RepID=UPI00114D0D43|nr:hypothetical protein [Streptomyces subrutilus]